MDQDNGNGGLGISTVQNCGRDAESLFIPTFETVPRPRPQLHIKNNNPPLKSKTRSPVLLTRHYIFHRSLHRPLVSANIFLLSPHHDHLHLHNLDPLLPLHQTTLPIPIPISSLISIFQGIHQIQSHPHQRYPPLHRHHWHPCRLSKRPLQLLFLLVRMVVSTLLDGRAAGTA